MGFRRMRGIVPSGCVDGQSRLVGCVVSCGVLCVAGLTCCPSGVCSCGLLYGSVVVALEVVVAVSVGSNV